MLVRLEQARELNGHFLTPMRRGLDLRERRDMGGHCDRDAPQCLNPLRQLVYEVGLLRGVLVE